MNAQSMTFTTRIAPQSRRTTPRHAGPAILFAMLLGLCAAQVGAMHFAGPSFAPAAETVQTF